MENKLVLGARTRESIKGNCPELDELGLMSVGVTHAHSPYEVSRGHFRAGHIIATIEGEGEFFYQGKWKRVGEGDVFINPPGNPEAFRAVRKKTWSLCWVHTWPKFFDTFAAGGTRFQNTDVTLFRHAAEGFIHSSFSKDYGKSAGRWADLIRFYAHRFMQTEPTQYHLEKVWAAVSAQPARQWSSLELAQLAGMSREQLRIHSHQETGRSPMQQVTHIRMQRAMELLQSHAHKQQVVAELVGYENAFAFSNAFFKSTGKRPSYFRPKK